MKKGLFAKAALFIMLSACPILGDSWPLPEPKKIYSDNKQYYIEIIPRKLESQLKFFSDKSKGIEPAGSPKGLKDNYCKGVFYKRNASGEYEKVWEQRLSNEVSPVGVLVSNGGKYVITFDNWHSIGYGDNVVAIYGPSGQLIRKMSLTDVMPLDRIMKLPRSVSSVYWGGEHRIDEQSEQLVLLVISKIGESLDDKPEYKEERVDLSTGEFQREKRIASIMR
jgi:hypothetical protein